MKEFTDKELQSVENFCLSNENVSITFQEPVNLLNIDLSNLVFDESKISLEQVSQNERLNKPSVIQFKKLGLKQLNNGKSKEEVIILVDKLVRKMKLDLIKPYDIDNTSLIYK